MRILFLAPHPFFQPRGTPIADRAVIETLSDLGHEIDVLAYHEGEPVDIPNCRIERIAAPPGVHGVRPGFSAKKIICDGYMLATALRLAGSRHYDLVHAVEESAFIAMILRARYGLPFVYDMDSSIAQQMTERHPVLGIAKGLLELAEGRAIRASVGVLTVCRSLEDVARRHAPGKLVARVEDASLVEAPGTDEAPTELGRPGEGGPVILYAGNLEPYQGIDLLLSAFQATLATVPEARLVIVGGADADVRRYSAQAARLGIGSSVQLLGPRPVDRLGAYLRRADVLVSPRLTGVNTPMKIFSYLDSGRAVIATRMPAHTQVLDDTIALLVRADAADLSRGMTRLLGDPELRRRLSDAAAIRMRDEFSRPALQRKVSEFYSAVETAIGAGGHRAAAATIVEAAR